MKTKFLNRLSVRLLITCIIPISIIIISASILCLNAITRNTTELVYQQLETETTSNCEALNSFLSEYLVMLSTKSSDYSIERFFKILSADSSVTANPYYLQVMEILDDIDSFDSQNISMVWAADYDSGIGFGNTDTKWKAGPNQWNYTLRPWYAKARESSGAFISSYCVSLYANHPVISIIMPIRGKINEQSLGAIGIDIDLDYFSSLFSYSQRENNTYTYIIDNSHTIIAAPDKKNLFKKMTTKDLPGTILESDEASGQIVFEIEFEGNDYIGNASYVQSADWYIMTIMPRSVIEEKVGLLTSKIVLIFACSLAALILILIKNSITVTKPIKRIASAVTEISRGNYSIRLQSSSKDELGQLANAVDYSIQTLRHRAMFDSLTDIYNEFAVYSKSETLMQENPETVFAIIRLDIAQFKMINDMFGESMGDRILKHIAKVLQSNFRNKPFCTYGRISGDIFYISIKYKSAPDLIDTLERLTKQIQDYPINFNLAPYFGICVAEELPNSASILFDRANLALSTVKGSILTNYAFYEPRMREQILAANKIEGEMDTALREGQFTIYLQPKCHIADGNVTGAEALVRWIHPIDGIISPGYFIPLFERNGFILHLDEYVWEEACKILKSWKDRGIPMIPVSVNVSRIHMYDPDFINKITDLIKKYDIPASMLELEFTESAFVDNLDELYSLILALGELGFPLSMDDFGSGFSSLNMLKNVPMDIIKIDREFLNETVATQNGKIIIKSTISMINQLHKQIIAEGVESEEQAQFLLQSGCNTAQGFYYSKPVNIKEFEAYAFHI